MHAMLDLSPESDRMILTVRMCKDGNREWLSSDGKLALVFFEKGKWYARGYLSYEPFDSKPRRSFDSEKEALDYQLTDPLEHLRSRRKDL